MVKKYIQIPDTENISVNLPDSQCLYFGLCATNQGAAANIAQALGVSLDYLTGISDQELDKEMLDLINDLQALKEDDQKHILKTLAALIRDANARKTYSS